MIKFLKYNEVSEDEILTRSYESEDIADTVGVIIENVRKRGDKALTEYSEKFDGAKLDAVEVTKEEMDEAFNSVDAELKTIMVKAWNNIHNFHSKQIRNGFIVSEAEGVITGQKVTPIESVGIYVPGGTAAYPSSVLMNSVPAFIAGCREIIMVTPPMRNGKVNPVILAAARIGFVNRIFKVGGAQAIAALAYGTESVPRVDKIVGPGNAYVAEAKRQVFGRVAIDMIAGPSEILVIADGSCRADYVAADLLSQAEHDRLASAVLITDCETLANAVAYELEKQLSQLSREDIARISIENNGKIILCDSITQAVDIANKIAPEHLEICVDNPFDYLGAVKNAGSVFLGKYSPEALGDYFAGPNHTLPTSGSARFSSPLSVDDFVKKTQYCYFTQRALEDIGEDVAYFAKKEGLTAHAKSVEIRLSRGDI